jgi:MinD superfamily P-loop ATPase
MKKEIFETFNRKPVEIPIIAVTGGKGGTGKTTIAVNLTVALKNKGQRIMLVDTDVDSPTTAIVYGIKSKPVEEVNIFIPKINEEKCNKCGKCVKACRAHALFQIIEKYPMFFEQLCSGCEACILACPYMAIENGKKTVGLVHQSSNNNMKLITGELKPNEARSAQVVTATKDFAFKKIAKEDFDLMVVDSPPGTHCNVVQSLRCADLALAVTEPTPLGVYDLNLILRLTDRLKIPAQVIINKADAPGYDVKSVIEVVKRYDTEIIAEIPYDKKFFQVSVDGNPFIIKYPESTVSKSFMQVAESVLNQITEH